LAENFSALFTHNISTATKVGYSDRGGKALRRIFFPSTFVTLSHTKKPHTMKTIQTIAASSGKHFRTVKRKIQSLNGELIALNGGKPFSFGLNDVLPEGVAERLEQEIVTPGQAMRPAKALFPAPSVPEIRTAPKRPEPAKVAPSRPVDDIVFKNKAFLIGCAGILIGVDALSFAWIAWNTYPTFHIAASVVFALAGMATGYSAIKNILSYKGWDGSAWAWGFGLFQLSLHLCAMEVLGEWSFFLGKIVISVGLPLATAGLATALKMDK
jgi:hypothetical protein